eukprot:5247649-Amphidinium_carterae.3
MGQCHSYRDLEWLSYFYGHIPLSSLVGSRTKLAACICTSCSFAIDMLTLEVLYVAAVFLRLCAHCFPMCEHMALLQGAEFCDAAVIGRANC